MLWNATDYTQGPNWNSQSGRMEERIGGAVNADVDRGVDDTDTMVETSDTEDLEEIQPRPQRQRNCPDRYGVFISH